MCCVSFLGQMDKASSAWIQIQSTIPCGLWQEERCVCNLPASKVVTNSASLSLWGALSSSENSTIQSQSSCVFIHPGQGLWMSGRGTHDGLDHHLCKSSSQGPRSNGQEARAISSSSSQGTQPHGALLSAGAFHGQG